MILNHDKHFVPMISVLREFKQEVLKSEHKTLKICVERNNGYNYIYNLEIYANPTEEQLKQTCEIAERLVKSILWVVGGYKIYIAGDDYIYDRISADYTLTGARAFDGARLLRGIARQLGVVRSVRVPCRKGRRKCAV